MTGLDVALGANKTLTNMIIWEDFRPSYSLDSGHAHF